MGEGCSVDFVRALGCVVELVDALCVGLCYGFCCSVGKCFVFYLCSGACYGFLGSFGKCFVFRVVLWIIVCVLGGALCIGVLNGWIARRVEQWDESVGWGIGEVGF